MLKNRQDNAFFVEPFKFDLLENLKRTDVRSLSLILSVHIFVLDLCKCKVFFYKILCCVTLHCFLCYIKKQSPVYLQIITTRSKCVYLYQERMVFSNEDQIIIQNNYEQKSWSIYEIWTTQKTGIIFLLSAY